MKISPNAFLNVAVYGRPIPQGSKTPNRDGNGFHEASPHVEGWRKHIVSTIQAKYPLGTPEPVIGPVVAKVLFAFKPPKKIPATRYGYPMVDPDLDKIQRAVGDALTMSDIWLDDNQVIHWDATKLYVGDPDCKLRAPGVWIRLHRILEPETRWWVG